LKLKRAEVKDIITDELQLSHRCDEIDPKTQHEELANIIKDLKATMREKKLNFLSAPAIGYNKRIFCIDDPKDVEIKTFINPMPADYSENNKPHIQMAIETCSSFPGRRFLRFRQDKIDLYYMRPNGAPMHKEFHGLTAVKIQHELEHLEGIVLSDFGLELDENWEKLTDKEKDEIILEYKDSLDILTEKLNDDIIKDPEAKQLDDGIKFMTAVAKGEVELEGIK